MSNNNVAKRYDFVYIFDVKDGNPNGDPDFDNTPRFDAETFEGLVSDVCLKRKIRDYVHAAKEGQQGYDIYVRSGLSLEQQQQLPYLNVEELKGKGSGKKTKREDIAIARNWMCENFFDVRTFGAVMSTTDFWCGQVRGPVQLTFARSYDRVFTTEHGITRVAYTKETKRQETSAQTEMGRKHTIAYGLYRAYGFVNPRFASETGFTQDDLETLWHSMVNMLGAFDASASRGLMAARHLFVFEHQSMLGNAPAHKLFDMVTVSKKPEVEAPRSYADYAAPSVQDISAQLPPGVTVVDKVNP